MADPQKSPASWVEILSILFLLVSLIYPPAFEYIIAPYNRESYPDIEWDKIIDINNFYVQVTSAVAAIISGQLAHYFIQRDPSIDHVKMASSVVIGGYLMVLFCLFNTYADPLIIHFLHSDTEDKLSSNILWGTLLILLGLSLMIRNCWLSMMNNEQIQNFVQSSPSTKNLFKKHGLEKAIQSTRKLVLPTGLLLAILIMGIGFHTAHQ